MISKSQAPNYGTPVPGQPVATTHFERSSLLIVSSP